MHAVKTLFIVCSLLFLLSCQKEQQEKSITLDSFDEILLEDAFEVELIQGNSFEIKISGAENVLKNVNYRIEDSVLRIDKKGGMNWLNPDKSKVKLQITFPNIRKISVAESCRISTPDTLYLSTLGVFFSSKLNEADLKLNCGDFYYWNNHPCGGKLTLRGNCNYLQLWNSALTQIDASTLICQNALVHNSAKGDIHVNVINDVECLLKSSGNIIFHSKPNFINLLEQSGEGKVIVL